MNLKEMMTKMKSTRTDKYTTVRSPKGGAVG